VDAPKNFQYLRVGRYGFIEVNLGDFGVASISVANFFIGWIFNCSVGIARFNIYDADHSAINGVHAPETAAGNYTRVEILRFYVSHFIRGIFCLMRFFRYLSASNQRDGAKDGYDKINGLHGVWY
jgi:hypothetical protein